MTEMTYNELQNAYDALKRVHNATNTAVENLSVELERVKNLNAVLTAEKRQWEAERVNQQMIIQQTLTNSNDISNRYLEENNQLKEEIRRLRGK